MKKLIVLACMLFYTVDAQSQCGVVSGIQPETNLGNGSHLNADYVLDPNWNIYSYQWKINGMLSGTTQNILNTGIGYDDICLTIKATNPISGDSCESTYCQLYYTVFPWLASVNIIVYAGAIMVLFLFVVMLMNLNADAEPKKNRMMQFAGLISGGCLFLVFIAAITRSTTTSNVVHTGVGDAGLIKNLGRALFNDFVVPFEISSILFLSAMIGAVVLGKKEKQISNTD